MLVFIYLCIYSYWSTDLEPKVPLPDCASRFLRLAFFLELSSPKELRTWFYSEALRTVVTQEKMFTFWLVFASLCWLLQISKPIKASAGDWVDVSSANQTTNKALPKLVHVLGTWPPWRLHVWFDVWFLIGWDIGSQQKDVETVEWEWYDVFHIDIVT